jgi:hypothetical protein
MKGDWLTGCSTWNIVALPGDVKEATNLGRRSLKNPQ